MMRTRFHFRHRRRISGRPVTPPGDANSCGVFLSVFVAAAASSSSASSCDDDDDDDDDDGRDTGVEVAELFMNA